MRQLKPNGSLDNYNYIESVNRAGNRKYKLGLNQFADMTNEEVKASHLGFKPMRFTKSTTGSFQYANLTDVSDSVDWRTKGAVTPIKNQGQCGKTYIMYSGLFFSMSFLNLKNSKIHERCY